MVERVSTEPETADHSVITSTIYYVGYTVSTVALTMAVFIFSYFRELHCLRNRIHMNLMLAYIAADIVWILNMAVNVYLIEHISQAFCFIFVVLLHYTMLTHFLWMFVEGLYLYTLVVKTFQQGTAKLPAYLVIGWGVPLVVVVSWVVTRLLHPEEQTEHEQDLCSWLAYHWSDWVYQAPVIAVLAINTIFLCFVMYVLITKLRSDSSMRPGAMGPPGDAEQQQSKKAAKALLVLIPLLGITYILVIAGPTEGHAANVFAHVRALLLSTQGLLVAIFYCFLNTDVRHTLANRWERWREVRTLGRQRNGRAASVNWTNRDTESCLTVHHAQVGDRSPAFRNGHDQQSWLDKPHHVEAHM
ncbi:diuretic hormone receptor-like isoform X2 [Thrips palmi]|uniref:Diuretic hormone receptor n=1 Tax=Thrips palmi TaxID=161013 RepID=A0A6P8YZA7_THRPL|nr:diuretic hormone receptor-like isoform X2 [Thrips palmi]